MAKRIPVSVFESGERVSLEIIRRQAEKIQRTLPGGGILDSLVNEVLIVNDRRQIVFASKNFDRLASEGCGNDLLGCRLGEALGCAQSEEHEAGCGLTQACTQCGALQAILAALAGTATKRECRLTRVIHCRREALDLLICATPLEVEGEKFAVCSVQNIGNEKRLQVYEQAFFRDLLQNADSLSVLAHRPLAGEKEELEGQLEALRTGMQEVLEHVRAQRDLVAAESGNLQTQPVPMNSLSAMASVAAYYARRDTASGRRLVIAPESNGTDMLCDRTLFRRILAHLIRNALEASGDGDTVTVGCGPVEGRVRWWVRNRSVIPREAQLQMFNRSFTTKGPGRGIGTYSVKLLAERYLGGRCGFESTEQKGTLFYVELPIHPPMTDTGVAPASDLRREGQPPLQT